MKGNIHENITPKREVPFEEQIQLAKDFIEVVDNHSGLDFDTFAEVGQHVEGAREEYDRMSALISERRKKFNESVLDKKAFAEKLRASGEVELAEEIERLFKN